MELENEKIKYLQAEQSLKNLNISISQLEEGVNNISKTRSGVVINNEKDKINEFTNHSIVGTILRKL